MTSRRHNIIGVPFKLHHVIVHLRIILSSLAICLVFSSVSFSQNSQTEEFDLFPFLGSVAEKEVNVRAGQSVGFERLGILFEGSSIVIVGKNFSWYKIKLPLNMHSYVSSKYVDLIRDGIAKISGNKVNVRARPSIRSSVIGQIQKGALVRVLGQENEDWHKIEPIADSYGWILAKFVTFKSRDIPPDRIVELPTQNIYKKRKIVRERKKVITKTVKRISKAQATGIVTEIKDKAVSKDIRHQLIVNGKPAFFLKGYRSIIDGFLQYKVKIEGQFQDDIPSEHPVLLVTKINLIL